MTQIKGVDLSYAQGKLTKSNFDDIKASGIKFVILRIGYTGTSSRQCSIDSTFENQTYNCEFISDKPLTWFKNLDDIMSSDLIVTTDNSNKIIKKVYIVNWLCTPLKLLFFKFLFRYFFL